MIPNYKLHEDPFYQALDPDTKQTMAMIVESPTAWRHVGLIIVAFPKKNDVVAALHHDLPLFLGSTLPCNYPDLADYLKYLFHRINQEKNHKEL